MTKAKEHAYERKNGKERTERNPVGAGRPSKPIDFDLVNHMLHAGVEGTTIAAHFGMHPQTFYDRVCKEFPDYKNFTEYAQEKRKVGLDILRLKQYEVANEGDKTMLVWLGKQHLGQKEKVENTHEVKNVITIKFGE